MKLKHTIALIAAAGMNLGLAGSALAQSYYTALSLGDAYARALNASGQVAGNAYVDGNVVGFYTGANGQGMNLIPSPSDAYQVVATTIADNGQVGGVYLIQGTEQYGGYASSGFVTGPQGQGFTAVSSPDGQPFSWVTAINSQGKMAVDTTNGTYLMNTDGTGAKLVDSLGSSMTSHALNASGQVAGTSGFSDEAVAFVTGPNGSGIRDLGNGAAFSEAYGINASGQVVGFTASAAYQIRGFYTGPQGSNLITLGTFGGQYSAAYGINDLGQAVGQAALSDGTNHAFVSNFGGQGLFDLNSLILGGLPADVVLTNAIAINNAGQILASDALGRSYLLTTAVPEAQTHLLMLLGLGGMGWVVRRHKRAVATA